MIPQLDDKDISPAEAFEIKRKKKRRAFLRRVRNYKRNSAQWGKRP